MKEFKQDQQVIRQYLLGELNEAGKQQVEERVFTDSEYKQEVLLIEDELLEDYLAGTLSEAERVMFREHYLSAPRQRQKLRMARVIKKYAVENAEVSVEETVPSRTQAFLNFFRSRSRLLQFSFAAALVFVLITGSWVLFQAWRARSEQLQLKQELARLNGTEINNLSPDPSVLVMTLAPLQLREQGDSRRITLSPETRVVQLRLPIAADKYQSYQAVLTLNQEGEVFKLDGLKARRGALVVQIPSKMLSINDYLLSVGGFDSGGRFEEIGDYHLRVVVQQ